MSIKQSFTKWIHDAQDRICKAFEEADGKARVPGGCVGARGRWRRPVAGDREGRSVRERAG
jgi:coproporphyrinogen III oxidase